jgi:hypothetical protein
LDGNAIVFEQEATSNWPPKKYQDRNDMVGNPFIVIVKDKEYCVNHEWLTVGAKRKAKSCVSGGDIKKFNIFPEDWKPTVGETYYFCVAGLSRGGVTNVSERTPFKKLVWK